jgi:thymus-specific serine protease
MKFSKSLLLLCAAITAIAAQHDHNIRTRFLNQPIDHFNPFDRRTFEMRFFQNTQFFQDGGPIYIFLTADDGGGYGVYDDFIREGLIFEMANETSGLLFALEHRYFGQSRPTRDTDFNNLEWLNIHQTLADIARFVAHIKEFTFGAENSRVVLWGRSYAGSLAIWARQKYPNLIDIAWGSSSPLNAVVENSQTLVNSYATITQIGGPECAADIEMAMQMIEEMFDAANTSYVEEKLKLCYEMDHGNGYDLSALLLALAEDSYQFIQRARYPQIDDKCTVIRGLDTPDNPPADPLDGFSRWYTGVLYPNIDCFDFQYSTYVSTYTDREWDSIATIDGRRQRMWMRCTQLGIFPVSAGGEGHPFGSRFEIDFFRRRCADIFDNEL